MKDKVKLDSLLFVFHQAYEGSTQLKNTKDVLHDGYEGQNAIELHLFCLSITTLRPLPCLPYPILSSRTPMEDTFLPSLSNFVLKPPY